MKAILVRKQNTEKGDGVNDGILGKAIYYINTPIELKSDFPEVKRMYGVIWDGHLDKIVHTATTKTELISEELIDIEVSEELEEESRRIMKMLPFKYFE